MGYLTSSGIEIPETPSRDSWYSDEPEQETEGVHHAPPYVQDSSLERQIKLALLESLPKGLHVTHEARYEARKLIVKAIYDWILNEEKCWRSIVTPDTERVAESLRILRENRLKEQQ